jgi:hypothetical protein
LFLTAAWVVYGMAWQEEEKTEKVTALEQIITDLQTQLSDAAQTDAVPAPEDGDDAVSALKKQLEEARGA